MPIYRDKERGCWVFEFDRRVDGRRVRTRKRLPKAWDRATAEAFDRKEAGQLYGVAKGVKRHRWTIDEAVAHYLVERIPQLKAGHQTALELRLLAPAYTGMPLDALPEVCAKYTKDNRADLAPATIRNRLRYLTSACRWAWKRHHMGEHDPAARVVMPAVNNERQAYVSRAQMLRLAKACRHRPTRAMIRVAFYSGMRFSEIVAARIVGDTFVLDDTKNGDPRIVPLHPKVRCCLGYEWPTHFAMNYHWRKAKAVAGPAGLRFHDLRHSAATAMLGQGVALFTVGAVLGHKSQASTRRYAHHEIWALDVAVRKIGRKAA